MVNTTLYFFFNNHVIAKDSFKDEEIRKITPKENSLEKILFLKNKFEKNKEYTVIEDDNIFRNILIGAWDSPPWGLIEFTNDGRFEAQRLDSKDIKNFSGFWEFSDGTLKLSLDKKVWKSYKVKNYELWFKDLSNRKRGGAYSFSISFDKMILDMSSVLQISFYTK